MIRISLARLSCLLLVSVPLGAIDKTILSFADWAGYGMHAQGITVELLLTNSDRTAARVQVATLDLGPELGIAHSVQIYCPTLEIKAPMYSCVGAKIQAHFQKFGPLALVTDIRWHPQTQALDFSSNAIALGGGQIRVQGVWRKHWHEAPWSIEATATNLSIAELRKQWGTQLPLPKDWILDGRLAYAHALLSGNKTLNQAHIDAEISKFNLGNAAGTVAAQNLQVGFKIDAHSVSGAWKAQGRLMGTHGELLIGRLYWNFSPTGPASSAGSPAALSADFSSAWRNNTLVFDRLQLNLGQLLAADALASLNFSTKSPTIQLSAQITKFDLGALPQQTRAGLLLGTMLSKLEGRGLIKGQFEVANNVPVALNLVLQDLHLGDRVAGLVIDGLDGHVVWNSTHRPTVPSELSWQSANTYGIGWGSAKIQFVTEDADFQLMQGLRIPVLDGALKVSSLELRHIGDAQMSVRFDGVLEPLSMPLLCKAFGWPIFAGSVAGAIPQLKVEHGRMTLGGQLHAKIFDGDVTVGNLTMSDAFGARPQLNADISINRLDLAAVTSAFSFGQITGRLNGRIAALHLVGWEPTAFDTSLFSTPGDRSKKLISQRAVENISSIGGGQGATAALERGALRFFKEFHYQQLGLSCTLANDVCTLNGVEPNATGYYLVKGSGIPRIDVISDSRRVDWRKLVASLKELSNSQPTVTTQ